MIVPALKEWKKLLQVELEKYGNKQDDLVQVIRTCDAFSKEIQDIMAWLRENQLFVELIKGQYKELYRIRFGEPLPKHTEQETPKQLKELSREEKRVELSKLVLEKTSGSEMTTHEMLKELGEKGFIITAKNPNAVIGTILSSFSDEVESLGSGRFKKK
jgi:hypothetical protein